MKASPSVPHVPLAVSLIALASLLVLTGCAGSKSWRGPCGSTRYAFALIGDVGYSDEQVTNLVPNLIADLNRARVAFVVHDGDIKSASMPCTDELLRARLEQLQTIRHPVIYVPGDNEWSDCGTKNAGQFDPMERLERLREWFMPDDYSLGQRKLKLTRQSGHPKRAKFRENVQWVRGGVIFAGFNIPGSSNNHGQPEFAERNTANIEWLKETFSAARRRNCRAVMLIIQANPFPEMGSTNRMHAGYREFMAVLEAETRAFKNPVVLVHGDSHYFRIDKPLVGSRSKRRLENFTRVETFGNPDVHWLHVTVDPRDPQVFTFRQRLVPRNLVDHSAPAK